MDLYIYKSFGSWYYILYTSPENKVNYGIINKNSKPYIDKMLRPEVPEIMYDL